MKKTIAVICILFGIGSVTLVNAADNDEYAAQSDLNPSLASNELQITDNQQEKVNINMADAKIIANAINGIGVKRAQAIVLYREANGPFLSIEDLSKVKGISARFVKNRIEELNEKFSI